MIILWKVVINYYICVNENIFISLKIYKYMVMYDQQKKEFVDKKLIFFYVNFSIFF